MSHAIARSSCRGISYATIVLKATFDWVQGGVARVVDPEPVVVWDLPRSADPRSSLAAAAEIAPYLSHAAVLLSGIAYPPPRASEGASTVRLAVFGPRGPLLDKSVRVHASGEAVPLVYEEALATNENPSGSLRPRIAHPTRQSEPAGFGPIAHTWPPRTALLRGAKPPELTREGVLELGYGVDARYFNPAPADQQTAFLDGTETLLLEGVDRELACTSTQLGGVRVNAAQRTGSIGAAPSAEAHATPLRFALDMVVIDAGRRRFSLVWRCMLAPPADAPALFIEATLQAPNASQIGPERPRSDPPKKLSPTLTSTMDGLSASPARPALPFTAAGPTPLVVAPRPAPAPPDAAPAKDARVGRAGMTMMGLSPTASAPVMPFPEAPAQPRPHAPVIPATPYDPAFSPRAVQPALAGLTLHDAPAPARAFEEPTTAHPLETMPPITRPARVPSEPAVARPPSAPPPVIPPRATQASPPPLAPPAAATPPSPASAAPPAPLDDRGDARRASLLVRLRDGGAPRDLDLGGADLSDLDLSGQSFSGSKLEGADLSRANLRGAKLAGLSLVNAKLVKATLDGADLTRANLTGASLEQASLRDANLTAADLSKARAVAADLTGAKLVDASMVQIDAERAVLEGADLTRANAERGAFTSAVLEGIVGVEASFQGVSLVEARLTRAKLQGARFGKASLDHATFAEADLTRADLSRIAAPGASFARATMEGANLKQASVANASFSGASLARANLSRGTFNESTFDDADLTAVDARDARFARGNLARANLTGADFRDADLTGATLTGAIKVDTKLKGAKLPPGE